MLFTERLYEYSDQNSYPMPPYLEQLERETALSTVNPYMSCGPVMGRFLMSMGAWLRPRAILEIGSFTGYSALCLAHHLPVDGIITCIEINEEYEKIIKKYFVLAGKIEQLQIIVGDALHRLPALAPIYDLAFIDANKQNNSALYELILPLMIPGGTILVDNVLWYGNVVLDKMDKESKSIHDFNIMIAQDKRVKAFILPIRDGVQVIQKL